MQVAGVVNHFILATAGHVDHGKSALVEMLTGVHPDRLPKERARGLTIDLGFGHFDLDDGEGSGAVYRVGVIDVPGHEDFIKNMVAGVGSVNLALLAVAADDGWMPQTEEHLQILEYLGVTHAVIALTKADLSADLAGATFSVRHHLAGTAFVGAPIVPTSIADGSGFAGLRRALVQVLRTLPPVRDAQKPRLPVDRVFTRKGAGTVVTGTLTAGTVHRGQTLIVRPAGQPVRVRSLQGHGRELELSVPGSRTAMALPDVLPGSIGRGDTLTLDGLGQASETIDALVIRSARTFPGCRPAQPVRNGASLWFCHGTGSCLARVVFMDGNPLAAGATAWAQLRFEKPVYAWFGDRFILRDAANQRTVGGGVVLEPKANRRRFRHRRNREWFAEVTGNPADPFAVARALLRRDEVVKRRELLAASGFAAAEIDAALARLAGEGLAVLTGNYALDAAWWRNQRARARQRIEAEHRSKPQSAGPLLTELRAVLAPALGVPELFSALAEALSAAGYDRTGERIGRRSHQPSLPPHLQKACTRLQAIFLEHPLEPPSRSMLAPDAAAQAALKYLRDRGEVVELSPEVYLSRFVYARLRKAVVRYLETHGPSTASQLRQMLGTTRRVLIPLLEKLDRDGLTRREGDLRTLRSQSPHHSP